MVIDAGEILADGRAVIARKILEVGTRIHVNVIAKLPERPSQIVAEFRDRFTITCLHCDRHEEIEYGKCYVFEVVDHKWEGDNVDNVVVPIYCTTDKARM